MSLDDIFCFFQVLPINAFSRLFQRAKTQVMDVAQSPAVKFVGNVVTQITDATEHMDQRMDEFLTGIVRPDEGEENADNNSHLPVSNSKAPVLKQTVTSQQALEANALEGWGEFDFDDDCYDSSDFTVRFPLVHLLGRGNVVIVLPCPTQLSGALHKTVLL